MPVNTKITNIECQVKTIPEHFKLADNLQAALSQLGDGFFAWKKQIVVDGVKRTIKELNGEVLPHSGKTVKIRDYDALIDGIRISDKNKEQFNPNDFTYYTVKGSGTIYLVLKPSRVIGDDGLDRPNWARGVFDETTTPPTIDSGMILVAKLINVPVSGNITADMIDNSVKDYLIDIDQLNQEVYVIKNQDLVNLYAYIVEQIALVKLEIAQGDANVLAQIEAQLATLRNDISNAIEALRTEIEQNINTAIAKLKADMEAMQSLIMNQIQPIINQLSQDLRDAIVNLTTLIQGNTREIEELIRRLDLDESYITTLQQEVENPGTGLLDRTSVLEGKVAEIPFIKQNVEIVQGDVKDINDRLFGFKNDMFSHELIESDIDTGSTYQKTAQGFTLPLAPKPIILQDLFEQPDGSIPDPNKWIVNGNWIIENGMLRHPENDPFYTTLMTKKNDFVNFEMIIPIKVWMSDPLHPNLDTSYFIKVKPNQDCYRIDFGGSVGISRITYGDEIDPYWNYTPKQTTICVLPNGKPYSYLWFPFPTFTEPCWYEYDIKIIVSNDTIEVYMKDSRFTDWQYLGKAVDTEAGTNPVPPGPIRVVRGWQVWYWKDITIWSLEQGYESLGTIITKKLDSTEKIARARIFVEEEKPEGTNITYDISRDGGTNWITNIAPGDIINMLDSTGTPSLDMRLRINLSTTDSTKTPILKHLYATSFSGVCAMRDDATERKIKDKINEIINAINTQTTPLATPISPLE
jgi:hypothetical protein